MFQSFTPAIRDSQRRGACPTLEAPMQTGDGLLARLRIPGGQLTAAQLRSIAVLAGRHGNGLVEITARGNLQVRGLSPDSTAAFAAGVRANVPIETGLIVECSPLAGDDPWEKVDPRPVAATLRHATAAFSDRLGPKVTVVVDSAGQIGLASLKADVRLTAQSADRWQVSVGGGTVRSVSTHDAVELAVTTLEKLATLGPRARATDLAPDGKPHALASACPPVGKLELRDGSALGVALPFGSVDHQTLLALTESAGFLPNASFRLAPHHCLLVVDAPTNLIEAVEALGFVTKVGDPRLRISACIGSNGCASGFIPARALAQRLAPQVGADQTLHVSGCAKGCAHPRRADVTLVGRPDGYGLVIAGIAGDTPRKVLADDQLESALAGFQG